MPELIVNPDSPDAWEIELKPGQNSVGRGLENDVPVDHPSVCNAHCLITLLSSGAVIKDNGSLNGTFVDGLQIDEAALRSGQVIKIGEVLLRFEAESPPASLPHPPSLAADGFCKAHPKAAARFHCPTCAISLCNLCVQTRLVAGQRKQFCRACGGECQPLFAEKRSESPAFPSVVGSAFLYPFKHDGLILLGAGTVFFAVMDFLASRAPLIGMILAIFATGYLISYMQRILTSSAMGDDRMPDWPDFSSWGDVVSPFFQFLVTMLVSFAPAILIRSFGSPDSPFSEWLHPVAIVIGCIYFPMAFTAVSMFDTLTALNPLVIVSSIIRIFGAYILAILLVLTVFGVNWLGDNFLEKLLPIPILPALLARFLGLYLTTVEMRILGLLVWTKRDELGWFKR